MEPLYGTTLRLPTPSSYQNEEDNFDYTSFDYDCKPDVKMASD